MINIEPSVHNNYNLYALLIELTENINKSDTTYILQVENPSISELCKKQQSCHHWNIEDTNDTFYETCTL